MSERIEISEGELDVLAITGPEGTRYIDGGEIEARAIRQQQAEIDKLRADIRSAGQTLIEQIGAAGPENTIDTAKRAGEEIAKLRAELAAIKAAPVVAWLVDYIGDGEAVPHLVSIDCRHASLYRDLPNAYTVTDLVARQVKDTK